MTSFLVCKHDNFNLQMQNLFVQLIMLNAALASHKTTFYLQNLHGLAILFFLSKIIQLAILF